MINEEKVRLMTKAEMMKKQNKRELFTSGKFFKKDFVIFGVVKVALAYTIAFFLIITLIFLTQTDSLLVNTSIGGLVGVLIGFLWIYLLLLFLVILFSIIVYRKIFNKAQQEMKAYRDVLRELNELSEE